MRQVITIAIAWALVATPGSAVRELVILNDPLPAQHVEGVVLDLTGAPIEGIRVSDCTPEWASVLRSTITDSHGRFRLSRKHGKSIYYLRFDHRSFNPLMLKLKVDKHAPEPGITARPEIGG